ncbi:hypothetical protein F2Q69_00042855 [Brassica cretica]|uniref:Uncharacterized protein n=1 Tax=Brassica cretica TaxID=69181 RepID=A0A8S9NRT9_BRACR|nr:hypothetical protein F2Q69_00042855 [Brassica cretica]
MVFSLYKVAKSQVSNSKVWFLLQNIVKHSGCSAISRTITWVALLSGTVTPTVPRENLQISLCSVLFVPAGLSPIQCNSRPALGLLRSIQNSHSGCSAIGNSHSDCSA